jgi:hypothetical protein
MKSDLNKNNKIVENVREYSFTVLSCRRATIGHDID